MGRSGTSRTVALLAALALLVLPALLVLAVPTRAVAGDSGDVQRAVERVFSSHRIQGDLPEGRDSGSDDDTSSSTAQGGARSSRSSGPTPALAPAAGVASWLGWAAVGVGLLLLLLWLWGLRGRRGAAPAPATSERVEVRRAPLPAPGAVSAVERRASELAAEGRVDEAVHELLLDAALRILSRAGRGADVALTSREVGPAAGLGAAHAQAFTTLVSLVERSRFGGRPLAAPDLDVALTAYRGLAGAGPPSGERAA